MSLTSEFTEILDSYIKEMGVDFITAASAKNMYYPFTQKNPASGSTSSSSSSGPINITVIQQDCVDCALDMLCHQGLKHVAILNMANEYNCGGGFERMGGSQEEYLFRRTNLGSLLWPHRRESDTSRWKFGSTMLSAPTKDTTFYPFTECGGIFTPNIDVIGTGMSNGKKTNMSFIPKAKRLPLENNFSQQLPSKEQEEATNDDGTKKTSSLPTLGKLSIISIAAQDLRPNRGYNEGAVFDVNLTTQKFRTVFHIAEEHGIDGLVLGAIGCGAFRNPADGVAQIFQQLLATEYANAGFKEVKFAIIFSKVNLDAFQEVFGSTKKK